MVSRLLPFLQARGFLVEAFARGADAQARLRAAPCHLLIVELELSDMLGVELGQTARQERHAGAVLLMDDPAKSGLIVSALTRGIETFVPIPPDETVFLERIEMLLLAQWAVVVTQQQAQLTEELAATKGELAAARTQTEVAREEARELAAEARALADERVGRLEAQHREVKKQLDEARRSVEAAVREARAGLEADLATERRKVEQLRRDAAVLRDQLGSMHLVTGARSGMSDEDGAVPLAPGDVGNDDAFAAFEDDAPTAQFDVPTRTTPTPLAQFQFPSPGPAVLAPSTTTSSLHGRSRAATATKIPAPSGLDDHRDEFEPRTEKQQLSARRRSEATLDDKASAHTKDRTRAPGHPERAAPTSLPRTNASEGRPVGLAVRPPVGDDAPTVGAAAAQTRGGGAPVNVDSTVPGGFAFAQIQSKLEAELKSQPRKKEKDRQTTRVKSGPASKAGGSIPSFDDEEVIFLEDE
jgi:DNA-binding response OmpR family regulator